MNPQRALLADGYKEALKGFEQIQKILLSFYKNLNNLDDKTSEVRIAVSYLKNVTDAISNVLTKDSNKEIQNGYLHPPHSALNCSTPCIFLIKPFLVHKHVKKYKNYYHHFVKHLQFVHC